MTVAEGLIKRGEIWHYQKTVELFNPPRKVRLRGSTGHPKLSDARLFLQQKLQAVQKDDASGSKAKRTFQSGLFEYWRDHCEAMLKGSTLRTNESKLKRLQGKVEGAKAFPDVHLAGLHGAIIKKHIGQRKREGYAAPTINGELRFLGSCLNYLRKEANVDCPEVVIEKFYIPETAKTRWLDMAGCKELIASMAGDKQDELDVLSLLITTGARLNEIMSLRWDQVHLNQGCIMLYREKTSNEGQVGLTEMATSILTRRFSERDGTCPWVFPSRKVKGIHRSRPRAIDRAIKKMGLNDDKALVERKGKFTIHSLRDSFCSILAPGRAWGSRCSAVAGPRNPKHDF